MVFVPLMYVVCVAAGFDSITAVAVLFCSSAVGYAGGVTNAFTVGVAQSIADLPLFSGAAFRMGVFIFLLVSRRIFNNIHNISLSGFGYPLKKVFPRFRKQLGHNMGYHASMTDHEAICILLVVPVLKFLKLMQTQQFIFCRLPDDFLTSL